MREYSCPHCDNWAELDGRMEGWYCSYCGEFIEDIMVAHLVYRNVPRKRKMTIEERLERIEKILTEKFSLDP